MPRTPPESGPHPELPHAAELADLLLAGRERIRLQVAPRVGADGRELGIQMSGLTDEVLRRIFSIAKGGTGLADDGTAPSGARMAILATGGYGRRELAPFSDVDVTFAVSEEGDPVLDAVARRMFMLIMDVFTERAGLRVGYAYRLIEECAGLDQTIQTALMDARIVAGNLDLARRLTRELFRCIEPAAFAMAKARERESAWESYGHSVYVSEPNVKEGPGGIRDLHAVLWVAKARYGIMAADPLPLLARRGLLSTNEVHRLCAASSFVMAVRNHLHYRASRQADVLTADKQDAVAADLGLATAQTSGATQPLARALMEAYYANAEVIHRACRRVIDRSLEGPLFTAGGLVFMHGAIHPGRVSTDVPTMVSDLLRYAQEHGVGPSPELLESLRGHIADEANHELAAELERTFPQVLTNVLSSPSGVCKGIRLLLDLGLMHRFLPEFARLMRTSALSLAHRYTVGEHTLRAIEQLEQMRDAPDGPDSEYRRMFESVSRPEALFLAALLHDAGKVDLSRPHAETGAAIAQQAALRLGMDAEAVSQIAFLVRHHLLMSETTRLRDLHQEQTVRDFVSVVDTQELLTMLFLLTRADMEATGPSVWTPVQSQFLEDLYYRAEAALAGRIPKSPTEPAMAAYRTRVREELSLHNLPAADVEQHCALMPANYLLNTPPAEVAAHIRAVRRVLTAGGPVVLFPGERGKGFTVLTICTPEEPRPGLLSKIAGVLYAHDVAVHAAQVFTRESAPLPGSGQNSGPRLALDTLWIDFHGKELPALKRQEVEADLVRVLSGRETIQELLARKNRRLGEGAPVRSISANNDLSDGYTVIEIRTPDQRGLLYRITRAIAAQGWDIHSARINTVGAEARDAFYVTDRQGRKVSVDPAALSEAIRKPM